MTKIYKGLGAIALALVLFVGVGFFTATEASARVIIIWLPGAY